MNKYGQTLSSLSPPVFLKHTHANNQILYYARFVQGGDVESESKRITEIFIISHNWDCLKYAAFI